MAKINPNAKQVAYWTDRNEKMFLKGERDILEYAKSLKRRYSKASDRIEEEIQKFYGKFAVDNNYTMVELKKLLNRDELKSFKKSIEDIAEYATKHKLDPDYQQQIKLLRAKSRISRLDELKTKVNFEVEKLYNDVDISLGEQLQNTFEDAYYETIFNQQKFLGFSDNFAMLNTKAIQKAVSTNYMTENYSDVLWKNKTNLKNILNQQIPQGIILGYNPNKLAREVVSKRVDGQYYNNAVRLVRTEYNLILNDATAQGYKEAGIDKYQLLATLDSRTSDICREMDGEIFKVSEKEVGINYPPFHPNCRTTTIPYFEPDEFDTEIERYIKDENGIRHKIEDETDYLEWKNALKKDKNGTAIYENNDAPNYNYNDFKKSGNYNNDFEITGNVRDMYLSDEARQSFNKYSKIVNTAEDFEKYLNDKGIELKIESKALREKKSEFIKAVKEQIDYNIAAIEQYSQFGGLSKLKTVHFFDSDLDVSGQYVYRALGEGVVKDEGHIYLKNMMTGFQVMHEYSHAYIDSVKPLNEDVVTWSEKLNKIAGLDDKNKAYFGAAEDAYEAERLSDTFGRAFTKGKKGDLEFVSKCVNYILEHKL